MPVTSIKQKLLKAQVIAIAVSIVLFALASQFLLFENFKKFQFEKLTIISRNLAANVENLLADRTALLGRVELLDYHRNYRDLPLARHFSKFVRLLPVLAYVNEYGQEEVKVVLGQRSSDLRDFAGEEWFSQVRAQPNRVMFSGLRLIPELGEQGVYLYTARHGYFGNEFQGVLVAALPLRMLAAEMAAARIGREGYSFLLGGDGRVLFCSSAMAVRHVGAGVQVSVAGGDASLREAGGFGQFDASVIGEAGFAAWQEIPSLGWTMVAFSPLLEFQDSFNRILLAAVVVALGALGVGFFIARLLGDPVAENIKRAIRHTEEVAAGRMQERLQLDTGDELQSLGEAVNRLTESMIHARTSQETLANLVQSIIDPLVVAGADGLLTKANPAAVALFESSEEQLIGRPLCALFVRGSTLTDRRMLLQALEEGSIRNLETEVQTDTRQVVPVLASVARINPEMGKDSGVLGILRDISELRRAEEKIRQLAFYDVLTWLPNRALFINRLEQALAAGQRAYRESGLMFAVMNLDLDRFKMVNDSLGHQVGDQLLVAAAKRIKECLRLSDTVSRPSGESTLARLGGDEFLVHLQGVTRARDAAVVAQRVLDAMGKPFLIGDHKLFAPVSIGIALFPQDGDEAEQLIKHADIAMNTAKQAGGGGFHFYAMEMNEQTRSRLTVESRLRTAVHDKRGFVLYYQPKIDMRDLSVCGVEALLRWFDEGRMISPADFIPVAEETGVIVALGADVLRMACRQAKDWTERGLPPLTMAVNLSGRQLRDGGLLRTVSSCLAESGMAPELLELELTESTIMETAEDNIRTLMDLKNLGIRLAIDDFGTGYSSLAYLKRFPIDTIKIDRAFIRDIQAGSDDEAIVRASIAMSHSLNLTVVAEGVESEGQADLLHRMGCDQVQGFLYGRPMPAEDFERMLARQARSA